MDYRCFVPKQAVGANLVYFDLFNNHDKAITITSVQPVVSGAVAVTVTLGVDLNLTYTSAVGTGGTAATSNGSSLTAMTITNAPGGQAVPATITGRLTPTGGATAAAVISWDCVFSEETNAGAYTKSELVKSEILVPKGAGIRVVQGAVASEGNIGFNIVFRINP